MALSQFAISNAKPKDKPYLLSDGDGLHLRVHPSGGRQWRLRFRFGGKPNMMSLGPYPAVSLLQARRKRDRLKEQIAAGINPSLSRKLEKLTTAAAGQNTFGAIADEHLANLQRSGAAEQTISKNRWMLQDLAAPIRNRPVAEIKPAEVLDILKKIETSGRRDTAHRLRSVIGAVFRYAIATLRAEIGPHHHIAGQYLLRYPQKATWREGNRRTSNGEQINQLGGLALKAKPSVDFTGYWQQHIGKAATSVNLFPPLLRL